MNNRIGVVLGEIALKGEISGWQLIAGDGQTNGDAWLADADYGGTVPAGAPLVVVVGDGDSVPLALLDQADAWVLPGDPPATIARLLTAAVAPRGLQVADLSDNTAAAIGALSAEASRIAEALQNIAAREISAAPQPVTAATVRRLIRLRRERDRFLPAMLFADPAWDMLLDLMAARLEGIDVPISSLCIAAAVPTTTALRWIRTLSEAGLFERHADPTDQRRSHIRLTDAAADAVLGWLRLFIQTPR